MKPVPDVAPACDHPAPLNGSHQREAPGYLVLLAYHSTFFEETMTRLERSYDIGFLNRLPSLNGFQAEMSPTQVAQLRCDPAIKEVEHNGVTVAGKNGD